MRKAAPPDAATEPPHTSQCVGVESCKCLVPRSILTNAYLALRWVKTTAPMSRPGMETM